MEQEQLEKTAKALVAEGKGILAADETVPTLTKRFATLKIESTEDSRRTYREMFFTTPDSAAFISGVILQDETIRQKNAAGTSLAEVLSKQGIIPGIKVDTGAKVLAGSPDEKVTEGLDGLRDRLKEYAAMGARFAKWRAVIRISDTFPSPMCISANAHALARYAALCQEQTIVPIVEPEVLMDGSHTIERCEEVTSSVLHAVFHALFEQRVTLEGMLLKPNMVIAGKDCPQQVSVEEVAAATVRCSAPTRTGCGARNRISIGRAKRRARDGASECDQQVGSAEAMEDQLFLRSSASGSGDRSVARQATEPPSRSASILLSGQVQQCSGTWQIQQCLGRQEAGAGGIRASLGLARRLTSLGRMR